ncbi:MAG: SDR family NAD(P)-dependent oxidoreductase [Chloroflexi bacterium]|nr:SDR family NAD(P)-dependent oxidoreductase [Chloroflexota bacterium]
MALEHFSLDGKVAIVTGAGRGLGKAMAMALARAGADVVVASRSKEQLERVADEIRATTGRRSLAIAVDVTDSTQVDRMVEQTVAEFGTVHILVNNAGVVQSPGGGRANGEGGESPALEISDEEWNHGIATNLDSCFYCTRAAAKHMAAQKWGRVINITSVAGVRGTRGSPIYSAAKGGMVMLTKALAQQWAQDGITVNVIAPGSFPWRFFELSEEERAGFSRRGVSPGARIPIQRPGDPKELGPLVVFLASEAASYTTGELIVVDGGALEAAVAPTGYVFPGTDQLD